MNESINLNQSGIRLPPGNFYQNNTVNDIQEQHMNDTMGSVKSSEKTSRNMFATAGGKSRKKLPSNLSQTPYQDVVSLQIDQMENIFVPQLDESIVAKFQVVRDIGNSDFIETFNDLYQDFKINKERLDCSFIAKFF